MKKIIFTPIFPVEKQYYPEPSSKNIPEWYKKTNSYTNSKRFYVKDGTPNQTIKKCIPVLDSITAGYIIKTYVDVFVGFEDGFSHYSWPSRHPIDFHPIEQAPLHPLNNGMSYSKWISPWSIKTERGYSCLFVPPMHEDNSIFTILPGIVDTDSYISPINFPFVLNNTNFEGIIPAGTKICQVIPFKRDSFVSKFGKEKDIKKIEENTYSLKSKWLNSYKNKFWNKKTYL